MTYSLFRHTGSILWKKQPIQLTFFLTSRCNARCPFCFYLSTDTIQRNDTPELSVEEIDKMAASLGKLLWLAFSGGEIFLRDDLVEVVNVFYKRNRPAIILLPTNGLLPEVIYRKTLAILESCPESVVTVKLSLDGPEAVHDSLRGVPGAFQKTMATYRLLADLVDQYENFELGINSVFCAENQDSMAEIINCVLNLDAIKTHTVSLIRGEVSDGGLKDVDMNKYRETISMLESNLKTKQSARYRFRGARIKAAQDILQRRLIHRTDLEQRQVIPCYAGRLTLVVTETGDVYPCESFTGKLGNVREKHYDLRQVLRSAETSQVLAAIKRKECYCTHECYMMMNILFNPKLYPDLLREYLAL
jgi:radical SAM protein with 4Fe4S-binding SPASM domain